MFCETKEHRDAAETLLSELARAYPPPLQLNIEPIGDQDFLEARLRIRAELELELLNKVVEDIAARKAPYRQRIPAMHTRPRRELIGLVGGIILRCIQTCSPQTLLFSLRGVELESYWATKDRAVFAQAVVKQIHRLRNLGMDEKARVLERARSK